MSFYSEIIQQSNHIFTREDLSLAGRWCGPAGGLGARWPLPNSRRCVTIGHYVLHYRPGITHYSPDIICYIPLYYLLHSLALQLTFSGITGWKSVLAAGTSNGICQVSLRLVCIFHAVVSWEYAVCMLQVYWGIFVVANIEI